MMTRENLLRALIGAVMIACVAWIASCTEWVEVDVSAPLEGEAATNNLYAVQQLARRLGAKVATPGDLTQMPPAGATLMLSSWHWDMFPERGEHLRAWVQQGGNLVLFESMVDNPQFVRWLPIKERERSPRRDDKAAAKPQAQASQAKPDDEEEDDADDPDDDDAARPTPAPESAASAAARSRLQRQKPCHDAVEPDRVEPSFPPSRRFSLCGYMGYSSPLKTKQLPVWSLEGPRGPEMLRVRYGQGSVTTITDWNLLNNPQLFKGDNALAAVAALQIRRGVAVWFVTEEARTPLLRWVWQQGWVAVLLAGLALVLALWRGGLRFGPLAAVPVLGRRSMTEQIVGTAQFLRQRGAEALHLAQLRALDESARAHVRHYDTLDRSARAQAIARITGLDAQALGLALDRSIPRRRVDLPPTLELLETARRLLAEPMKRPGK